MILLQSANTTATASQFHCTLSTVHPISISHWEHHILQVRSSPPGYCFKSTQGNTQHLDCRIAPGTNSSHRPLRMACFSPARQGLRHSAICICSPVPSDHSWSTCACLGPSRSNTKTRPRDLSVDTLVKEREEEGVGRERLSAVLQI